MTRLFNDPSDFTEEMIEGFVAAHPRRVRRVPGGVVRSTRTPAGHVAVVVGGGSGHYPAFAGLVGPGLADGAVMGNVFASPSAAQIVSVAKAADHGGGVLLTYGNYAGDFLNFSQAEERLRAAGVDVQSVPVTDDIYSASADERHRRRGIAGDLLVFKVAAAAAAEGQSLAGVTAVANRANDRTRTMGVAFSGCTLPGADHPLFTVPEGQMAIGLGIHGEPGFAVTELPTADELAQLLVDQLLLERPDGLEIADQRVVALLNGLGSVKHEELFVVYRRVAQLLEAAGLTVVEPEVGEICTSFEMAGVSLTLMWLDPELERLWAAPADTPAFRKGRVDETETEAELDLAGELTQLVTEAAQPAASAESQTAAAGVVAILRAIEATIDEMADELGRIDSVAGDGDHGIGMQRGSRAATVAGVQAYAAGAGAGSVLNGAADAWADRAGGTSGALWGVALRRIGTTLGDQDRPTLAAIAQGVHAARLGICEFGKAEVGDKTMVDVLVPVDETLTAAARAGASVVDAWDQAATAAEQAAIATQDLLPRMGRARPHAEKSLGTPDAGAVSLSAIVRTVHHTLVELTRVPADRPALDGVAR